jgi:nicotinamidase/pyrazinamidase
MENAVIFVDVDTQNDFMLKKGALPVPDAEAIIPVLELLTRTAESKGIPILATLDTHSPDDPEFSRFPPHCVKDTPGWEKIPATCSQGSQCFQKATYDIFSNPDFIETVKRIDPRTAVVYGVATDYCVKAAVLGLVKIVPRVLVVEDAVRAVDPAEGPKALDEMKAAGAKLITADRVNIMLEEDGC